MGLEDVFGWFAGLLAAAIFLILILPWLIGLQVYVVKSGSMAPKMPTGSLLYTDEVPEPRLEERDVIAFRPENSQRRAKRIVHRIVEVKDVNGTEMYRTKGDANPMSDPGWTSHSRVLGEKVFSIPYVGGAVTLLKGIPMLLLLALYPLFIVSAARSGSKPESGPSNK